MFKLSRLVGLSENKARQVARASGYELEVLSEDKHGKSLVHQTAENSQTILVDLEDDMVTYASFAE